MIDSRGQEEHLLYKQDQCMEAWWDPGHGETGGSKSQIPVSAWPTNLIYWVKVQGL